MSDLVASFFIEPVLSDDETTVSLRASARLVNEAGFSPISLKPILDLIGQRGFGRFRINEEKIEEIILALTEELGQIDTSTEVKNFVIETDGIAEAIDATAEVDVAKDQLEASLNITPAEGGKHLLLAAAEQLLEENKVTYGVDKQKLDNLLSEAQRATDGGVCSAVVAFALMPVAGIDSQFIPLVMTANERILKPKILEDGSVDMHDLGELPTVAKNVPVMRREPATKGEKGINVNWEFLAPDPGIEFEFKLGKGTIVSSEDSNILLSLIAGQPNLTERGMKVDDAVAVKAVDLHTGNINLDANLMVKGDIAEGMKVRCKGDITVGGVIESADVRAKGNIIVGKGIIGRTTHPSSKGRKYTVYVQAKGSISAAFASYAKLQAVGDINMIEQLLHCNVSSKGKVVVGNDKTLGSQIVGGITKAYDSIESDIFGSSAGVITQLDLSGTFQVKYYEVACNRSILDGTIDLLDKRRDDYSLAMNLSMSGDKTVDIDALKSELYSLEKKIDELEKQGDMLVAECSKLCKGLAVKAKKTIQPNVMVRIGFSKLKTSRKLRSGDLYYDDGKISYNPHT